MDRVVVYIFDTNNYSFEDLLDINLISNEDIMNARKYKFELDQKEHLISSYLKNKYIPSKISLNKYGKPLAPDIFFNLSHSKGVVAMAIGPREIGIDVEKIRGFDKDLVSHICSEEEANFIHGEKDFYCIWTAKESICKANGEGIRSKISLIPALPINGFKTFKNIKYYSKNFENKGTVYSISMEGDKDFEIDICEIKK